MRKKAAVAALAAALGVAGFLGFRQVSQQVEPGWDRSQVYEVAETQDIKYRAVPTTRKGWGTPKSLPETISVMRERLSGHRDGGFAIRPKNRADWSRAFGLNEALDRLSTKLGAAQVEAVWLIRAEGDDYAERAKKVDLNPAVILDTPGTRAVDIIIGTTIVRFPTVTNLGVCVCKRISGSWSWSQHAYCNAVDFGGNGDVLDQAANYLHRLTLKGYVPVSELLWRGRNMLTGHAVSGHYYHVHVSGKPLVSGTPTCAR